MTREVWEPDALQKRGVEHLIDSPAAGLLASPGLGKTSMTLRALVALKATGLLKGAIIFAPRRPAVMVWPQELDKWDFCSGLTYEVLSAERKRRAIHRKADVYITNYESIPWLTRGGNSSYMRALVRAGRINIIIYDELTKMKQHNSLRAAELRPWLKFFDYRWGLTGSFAAGGLESIYGQVQVLDGGATFGGHVTAFRRKYFLPVPGTREWVPKPLAEKQIMKAVAPMMLRLDDSHLELPKLRINDVRFDLPPKARRVYDELLRKGEVKLPNGRLVAAVNAGVLTSLLRQVATGFLYLPPIRVLDEELGYDVDPGGAEKEYYPLHTERYDAAANHLEELEGHQCLVGFIFIQELRDLFKYFKKEYPVIGGGGRSMKDADLIKMQNAWNARKIETLFGNPASVAHGLNLQGSGAEHVLLTSTPWGYERLDQFIRRLRRRGTQARKIVVTRLIARDTVDEAVIAKLRKGQRVQDAVHEYLKVHGAPGRLRK